jgi:hypothetical protein
MDVKEVGFEGVDWIYLAQDREQVAGCFVHGNEPVGSLR